MTEAAAVGDVASAVRTAKSGKGRGVYLIVGEPSDTNAAAKALLDVFVPEDRRSFNFECYEGRTTPLGAVLDSLRTPGFFPGTKLVWVKESAIFLSNEKKSDVAKAMLAAWNDKREQEAAEKLLTLAALAGLDEEDLKAIRWQNASKSKAREVFGEGVGDDDLEALDAIQNAAFARELRVGAFRDEAASLAEWIEAGLPRDAVLLFTASAVDARKRIVKIVRDQGVVIDLTAEHERSGALARSAIEQVVQRVLADYGKRLERDAYESVIRRVGSDTGSLATEVEKLCLFVGERSQIGEADVREVMRDMAEAWVFDLTGALASRDASKTLAVLRALFAQGEPPLRLVGLLAREFRLLLVARECLATQLRGKWTSGIRFDAFQSKVLPAVDAATRAAFGNAHPFVLFKRFQDAARIELKLLRAALIELAEIDLRLKSTPNDAATVIEVFALRWCRWGQRSA